ncbi:hypothetical protein MMF93_24865 [Streptomyces tubbatahanensis]|uniref:Uncharacterized protein n=1 Tax=Streptomyces tubbatahanensis TaxID=2923272 RepID=A0ABY3XXS7_9ACTN|nr:hypothetical protein [Streptomyces tubbatahanensis]UNS99329.1 hypothetical protein MMF93_24865 [Streptomyces tubbatahanensis]
MGGTDGGGAPKPGAPDLDNPSAGANIAMRDLARYGLVTSPYAVLYLPGATTDFEKKPLGELLDMVRTAKPSDLETVANALYNASKAIKSAGSWLQTEAERAEWEGEAERACKKWAVQLGKNTQHMGGYAETVSTELSVMSLGLAGTQGSMPKDEEVEIRDVEEIPKDKRNEDNPKYKQYKKNHNAALIQMNRIASYYDVSSRNMAVAEGMIPQFEQMPNIGVPPPRNEVSGPGGGPAIPHESMRARNGAETVVPGSAVTPAETGGGGSDGGVTSVPHGGIAPPVHNVVHPDAGVSTAIDTVSTPPAPVDPVQAHSTPHGPSGPGPTTTGPGQPPTLPGPLPQTGRSTGPGMTKSPGPMRPSPAPMRPGPVPPPPTGRQTTGPTGRSPVTGLPTNAASRDPQGTGGRTGPMGRPGMMHPGMTNPNNGTSNAGRGTGSGTARASQPGGIVGGTPSRATPRPTSPGIPRGTVVGTEGGAPARRAPMGVPPIGSRASETKSKKDSQGRRVASTPGGIVGTPRKQGSDRRRGSREFTSGGSGLVREDGEDASSTDGISRPPEDNRATRSDDPAAREAPPARRPNSVPPVIE